MGEASAPDERLLTAPDARGETGVPATAGDAAAAFSPPPAALERSDSTPALERASSPPISPGGTNPAPTNFVMANFRSPASERANLPTARWHAVARRWRAALAAVVETERARGVDFLLVPIFLGAGAFAYHAMASEPPVAVVAALVVLAGAVTYLARGQEVAGLLARALLVVALGIAAARFETWRLSTPMLGSAVTTTLTGRIIAIERQASGRTRLVIDVTRTAEPKLNYPPARVRVTAARLFEGARPGIGVEARVRLLPVSGPVRPGGYDFSWRAFFEGYGASGFLLGRPAPAAVPAPSAFVRVAASIEALRTAMADRIRARIGGPEGEIAAALTVGASAGVPRDLADAMRLSGLFHVLSISGLHMALVAGLFLAGLRFGLALVPGLAERFPVKKIAAATALAGATFYLFLSGAAVATQRSYLMIAVMLLAVMADRAALTMRNLAIAALVIIIAAPHEVAGPSFQLSFAATAALIAGWTAFSRWRAGKVRAPGSRRWHAVILRKAMAAVIGVAATSLMAGGATTLYAAWHFQRVAPLGLVSNLAAMPVVSLVIMPAGTLAVLLMPFGLDGPLLDLMGRGVAAMDAIAMWTAVHSPVDGVGLVSPGAVIAGTVALAIAAVTTTRLAWAAIPFAGLALALVPFAQLPDAWISEDGKLVGVVDGDRLLVDRPRPNAFTLETWRRAANAAEIVKPGKGDGAFECVEAGCRLARADGAVVVHVADGESARPHCAVATLIVIDDPAAANPCAAGEAAVVGARALALLGSAAVTFVDRDGRIGAEIVHALSEPLRPWNTHRRFSREARGLASPAKP